MKPANTLAADGGGRDHEPPRLKRHVSHTKRTTGKWRAYTRKNRIEEG